MSLPPNSRQQARRRAKCGCIFCGVLETNVDGLLRIDHFKPQSKGGSDELDNLIYSCAACNQYKQDYYPTTESEPHLWNPRREAASTHFVELDDGQLVAISSCGEFTIRRLRLNRAPLIKYRMRQRQKTEEVQVLKQYQNLIKTLSQMNEQLSELVLEQQLLQEQQNSLRLLLEQQSSTET